MNDIFGNLWCLETSYVDCTPKQYREWILKHGVTVIFHGHIRNLQDKRIGPGVIRVSKVPLKKVAEDKKPCNNCKTLRSQVAGLVGALTLLTRHTVGEGYKIACNTLADIKTVAKDHDERIARKVWKDAAIEARKTRLIFLTKAQVMDGALSDDHPTMKIRKQMREEIAVAFEAKAE